MLTHLVERLFKFMFAGTGRWTENKVESKEKGSLFAFLARPLCWPPDLLFVLLDTRLKSQVLSVVNLKRSFQGGKCHF